MMHQEQEDLREEPEKAAAEQQKPQGRRNPLVADDGTDGAEVPAWKMMILGVITAIIAIDDEWIWLPGAIYGCMFYMYKRVKNVMLEIASIPPECIACGAAAAGTATTVSPPLSRLLAPAVNRVLNVSNTASLARALFLSPGGVVSPLTWGLRLSSFTYLLETCIQDTHHKEDSLYRRVSNMLYYSSICEVGSRVAVAPLVKAVDLTRKSSAQGEAKPHFAVLRKVQLKGVLSLWEGMAPLRVEVPHMALLLSTWALTRERLSHLYSTPWDENADAATTFSRAVSRIPADLFSGALASTVAHTATHQWRVSFEDTRMVSKGFTSTYGLSTCPLVTRHGNIPLNAALGLRVPHTSLIFGLYGFALNMAAPQHVECGVVGWGEHEVERHTAYGGSLHDEKVHGDSFWAFFGVRYGQKRVYNTSMYQEKKED